MLTMIHANPAHIIDGRLRVDRKFHLGMLSNVQKVEAQIVTVHWDDGGEGQIMDPVEVPLDKLGYGVMTVKVNRHGMPEPQELERLRSQIARSRVMYGNALGSVSIARELGVPYVMFIEYDLKTQISVATSEVKSPVRKAVRMLRCALNYALNQVPEMRNAISLHCNGYPIFDESRRFNDNRLLYLDSRMTRDFVISEEDLAARLENRHRRPLRLLYSGRYAAMKGANHAVKVGLECIKLGIDIEMHCYGQGDLKQEMQALAAEASGKARIFIHDAIPYPELVELSRTFDIFVCCHVQADPSCTYLESFGAGLPIVGYNNRMWKRLSEESGVGFFSPIGEPKLVAEGIYKLAMQNDLLVSMSHKARNFALEHCFEKEFELRTEAINAALASTPARNRIVQQAI